MNWYRATGVAMAALLLSSPVLAQEDGAPYTYAVPLAAQSSNAYPDGQFAAQLAAARGDIAGPCGACDWGWGNGGSPYRTGPGLCDDFRVGPRWTSSMDGVFLYRDKTDLAALAAGATAGGVVIDPSGPDTVSGNFEHGAGVRLSLASNWNRCKGYELQIAYTGVFGWDAGAFDPDVPYAGPLPEPNAVETQKSLNYRSMLHSIEVNGLRTTDSVVKAFGGVRYVLLGEDVSDLLDESSQPPLIPPNAADGIAGDPPLDVTDILRGMSVDNNLIGFQAGMRTDFFSIGDRFHVEGYVNAGAYCNFIVRKSSFTETRTYNQLNDPSTPVDESVNSVSLTRAGYKADRVRAAFVGEALLGGVYQVNNCTQAKLGYQLFYLTGVELADQAFVGATPTNNDLLLHGWFAGVEYRR